MPTWQSPGRCQCPRRQRQPEEGKKFSVRTVPRLNLLGLHVFHQKQNRSRRPSSVHCQASFCKLQHPHLTLPSGAQEHHIAKELMAEVDVPQLLNVQLLLPLLARKWTGAVAASEVPSSRGFWSKAHSRYGIWNQKTRICDV